MRNTRSHLPTGLPLAIAVDDFELGTRTDLHLPVFQNALGTPVLLPFIVVRGRHPGPTVGICAAVHGNELNGISIIHHVLESVEPEELSGALVCVPVVNAPAFEIGQRNFPEDGVDLNHAFPGKRNGTPSQQYAKAFSSAFLPPCDYILDIHTASEGRTNTFYVRADLTSPEARRLALLVGPQIVLHGRSGDGTLRNAARRKGIAAVTLEAGNPSVFQGKIPWAAPQDDMRWGSRGPALLLWDNGHIGMTFLVA